MNQYTTKDESLTRRQLFLRDSVYKNAKVSPFFSILQANSRTMSETNQKFEWIETERNATTATVESADNSTTQLKLKGDAPFIAADSLLVNSRTGEQMLVKEKEGRTITVQRAFGGKASNIQETDILIHTATSFEEGSLAPKGSIIGKRVNFNYCQVFRRTLRITRNKLKQGEYGDNGETAEARRKLERNKILRLHQSDIENALLFGMPHCDLSGETPRYTTGGILSFIKTNIEDIKEADFKVQSINAVLGRMADRGSAGDKIMLTGSGFNAHLNNTAVKNFAGGGGTLLKKIGITLDRLDTEYGELNIMYNPVLSAIYPNSALILDLSELMLHFIEESKLMTNIEYDGYDGVADTFLTDCGLEVSNESCHGFITIT